MILVRTFLHLIYLYFKNNAFGILLDTGILIIIYYCQQNNKNFASNENLHQVKIKCVWIKLRREHVIQLSLKL